MKAQTGKIISLRDYSPNIDRIEVLKVGRVRRSKLYYLRGLSAKKARIKEIVK